MRFIVALATVTLIGCGQEIVTVQCDKDAHTNPPADSGVPNADGNVGDPDGGMGHPDATTGDPDGNMGHPDANDEPDSGGNMGCVGSPYCITMLVPSREIANVRESITVTPTIDNPTSVALTFTAPMGQLTAERRSGFPALVMSQIDLNYLVDANGTITFAVTEVPVHFTTTTFVLRLTAKGPGPMPEVTAEARVTIRGNTVFSNYQSVYAVASDGRPARATSLSNGRLIDGTSFVRDPAGILLARDGTLIVYDQGATPERLRRFELSGENVHLGDFAYQDSNMEAYIYGDQSATGLTQLMDGRFAMLIYDYERNPDSAVVLWNEDGTYDRTWNALDPNKHWQGMGASQSANELLIAEYGSSGRLFSFDPMTGTEISTIATDIANPWAVLNVAGGNTYVGITGGILRVTPQGGKTMISMLMGNSIDYWNYLTLYSEGKVIAARDVSSDYSNIAVIEGTTALGWLRPQMVGGASGIPQGLAYLE